MLLSERDGGLDGAGGGKLNMNPPGDAVEPAAPARLLFGVPYPPPEEAEYVRWFTGSAEERKRGAGAKGCENCES